MFKIHLTPLWESQKSPLCGRRLALRWTSSQKRATCKKCLEAL